MAITIPIISEFNAKGVKKAIAEFKQLEGAGAKAQFALKKAVIPASAALAGLASAAMAFGKAAAEDQLAADQLALALRNNTKATDAQIKANEEYISSLSMASAVADDELRPALQKLAIGTGDLKKAQTLLNTALNVSAGTGVDLQTVSDALAKGYNGNTKALAKLSPQMKKIIKDGASFTDVVKVLDKQFAGANKTFANSAQGGFKRMGIALQETKESIGAALLPVVQAVVPWITKLAEWAQKNPGTFKVIALALAGVAAAIMLINAAMALNPINLIVIAVAAVIAVLVLAYKKFTWFKKGVDFVWKAIKIYFGMLKTFYSAIWDGIKWVIDKISDYIKFAANIWIRIINVLISAYNAIPGHKDIKPIQLLGESNVSFPEQGATGNEQMRFAPKRTVYAAPSIAASAVSARSGTTIQVNVNGADPNAVVQTLRKYGRQTGAIPIRTAPIG